MTTNKAPRDRGYSIKQAAYILGISTARLSKDVHERTIRTRRGRVSTHELVRLLDGTEDFYNTPEPDDSPAGTILDGLAEYRFVPTDVLSEIVADGCADIGCGDAPPDGDTDYETAAGTCRNCTAPFACIELAFRTDGPDVSGVWGGLSELDLRTLYTRWALENGLPLNGEEEDA